MSVPSVSVSVSSQGGAVQAFVPGYDRHVSPGLSPMGHVCSCQGGH